jgi:hypothetical protein
MASSEQSVPARTWAPDLPETGNGAGPLRALGFSGAEERLYRLLLRNSGSTLVRLGELLGRTSGELRELLGPFERAGLVDVGTDIIMVHPPETVLGPLISAETRRLEARSDQLAALRALLPSLSRELQSSGAPTGEPVMIEAVDAGDVVELVRTVTLASTGEMLWMRPDQWRLDVGREIDALVKDVVASGRPSRALYPARVLEEAPEVVRGRAEAGEHVRILASVPSRVSILGSTAALLSEDWGSSIGLRLVVRHHALIGALTALFDNLWDRAMPVPGLDASVRERRDDRGLLLDQLAGGARDEQIARALGVSLRTVRRRVAEILDELGVESRFQAGVEAVRRGWL